MSYNVFSQKISYPSWLKVQLGYDYFETVDGVAFAQHKIADDVLAAVARLPDLKTLKLPDCNVTKDGLSSLVKLGGLKWLELTGTPTTDEGLREVGQLRSVEILDLRDTDVTDEGISTLGSMRQLKQVFLGGSTMTPAGIERLRKSARLYSYCNRSPKRSMFWTSIVRGRRFIDDDE